MINDGRIQELELEKDNALSHFERANREKREMSSKLILARQQVVDLESELERRSDDLANQRAKVDVAEKLKEVYRRGLVRVTEGGGIETAKAALSEGALLECNLRQTVEKLHNQGHISNLEYLGLLSLIDKEGK